MSFCLALFVALILNTTVHSENPLLEGFSFIEKGDYKKAFSTFSSVKPRSSSHLVGMGISKYLQRDYATSTSYLTKAIKTEKESKNWVPNYFLALSLYEQGLYEDAIYYLRKTAKIKKMNPEIYLKWGQSEEALGKMREAEELFKRCLDLDPKFIDAYLNLVRVYHKQAREQDTMLLIDKGLKILGENPLLLYEKAKLLFKLGKLDEAEKELALAMKSKTNTDMQNLFSSIAVEKHAKNTKIELKTENSLKTSVKTNNYLISRDWIVILSSILPLMFVFIMVRRFKAKKVELQKAAYYANELIKKCDLVGAEEVLRRLIKAKHPSLPLILTRLNLAKGNIEMALEECKNIVDDKKMRLVEGLIYIVAERKEDLEKHLSFLENLEYKEEKELLRKLSLVGKDEALRYILEM